MVTFWLAIPVYSLKSSFNIKGLKCVCMYIYIPINLYVDLGAEEGDKELLVSLASLSSIIL